MAFFVKFNFSFFCCLVILVGLLLLGVDVVILGRERPSRPLQPARPSRSLAAPSKGQALAALQGLPELWEGRPRFLSGPAPDKGSLSGPHHPNPPAPQAARPQPPSPTQAGTHLIILSCPFARSCLSLLIFISILFLTCRTKPQGKGAAYPLGDSHNLGGGGGTGTQDHSSSGVCH